MVEQSETRGRGRPPKHGKAMSGAVRQRLYAQARGRDMAEVAYALKQALGSDSQRKAFIKSYRGTTSSPRLRRGLARILHDDPAMIAFFDNLILSDDEK